MYRQDFHLQTLTCLAMRFLHCANLFRTDLDFASDFSRISILYRLGVLFVAILEQTLMSTLPGIRFGTLYPPEPSVLVWAGSKKPCSFNSILVVTNPNFLHELAPLYVQTGFPSSDIDSVWPCHFLILQACFTFMWQSLQKPLTFPYYTSLFHTHVAKPAETFGVRSEVKESEVRHLWHCQIWQWPRWTIV